MGLRTFDKNLELRDIASGAVTATGNGTTVAFDGSHAGAFMVEFYITAIDGTSGDETYVLSVQTDDAASTGFVTQGQVTVLRTITPPQTFQVMLHSQTVNKLRAGSTKIRAVHTLAGTTPSITYGAVMSPVAHGGIGQAADIA